MQGAAADELHGDEGIARGGAAGVEDADDAVGGKPALQLALLFEAAQGGLAFQQPLAASRGIVQRRSGEGQDLDGDDAVRAFLRRAVNVAISASSDQTLNLVRRPDVPFLGIAVLIVDVSLDP
jgi:hypothetical protein